MENQNINNHPKLKDYNETIQKLLDGKMYQQAAATCRLALEYMASQFVIEFSQSLNLCDTLFEKINGLKTNGIIDNDWVENSDFIRKIVNDGGAHDNTASTGHVIDMGEARAVFNKLNDLESNFLNKLPVASTKEIKDEFKNKRFEEDNIVKRLKENPYIFNVLKPHESYGTMWYTFYYKVKTPRSGKPLVKMDYQETCGQDGGYLVYKVNEKRDYIVSWINNYFNELIKNNNKTIDELDAEYEEHLAYSKKLEEVKKRRIERDAISYAKEQSEKMKKEMNHHIRVIVFYIFIWLIFVLFLIGCLLVYLGYNVYNLDLEPFMAPVPLIISIMLLVKIYNKIQDYKNAKKQLQLYNKN